MAPQPLRATDDGYRAMASLVPNPVVVVDSALRVAVVRHLAQIFNVRFALVACSR